MRCFVYIAERNKHGSCKEIILQKFVEMTKSSEVLKEEVRSKKTKFCEATKYKSAVNKEWFNNKIYRCFQPLKN